MALPSSARIALDVEDVVLDLEGEADLSAEVFQGGKFRAAGEAGCERTEQHTALDERPGLATVHVLDVRDAEPLAYGGKVDRLPAGHAAGAGGGGQHADHLQTRGC